MNFRVSFWNIKKSYEEREGNNEFGTVEGAAEKEEKGKSLLLFVLISLVAANEIKLGTFVGGVIEEIILDFCSENKVWEFKIYPIYFRNESDIFNLLNIIFVKDKLSIEKHLETLIKLKFTISHSIIFLPEIVLIFIFIKYLVSIIFSKWRTK